jgi:hypothetical protein
MLEPTNPHAAVARTLAPVLYLQRDESFRLRRVVAVLHPTRPIIAYHLLWGDDVHFAWVPFTKPTDEEIVWVGYDSTGGASDLWTYWHGKVLHTNWRGRGTVEVDVQWGKHGSLPRGTPSLDEPWPRTLEGFWMLSWFGLPDLWLGRLQRKGPLCFCHGLRRYQDFSRPVLTGAQLDAIVELKDPEPALTQIFGRVYSKKRAWP